MAEYECESARNCEYLIRQYGPMFMGYGGGGTAGENANGKSRERRQPLKIKEATIVTPALIERMIALHGAPHNKGVTKIAAELGCAPSTVWARLKNAGVLKRRVIRTPKGEETGAASTAQ